MRQKASGRASPAAEVWNGAARRSAWMDWTARLLSASSQARIASNAGSSGCPLRAAASAASRARSP